jgi:hypothetical protein
MHDEHDPEEHATSRGSRERPPGATSSVQSATDESLARGTGARAGEGPPVEHRGDRGEAPPDEQVDGAAEDAGPGDDPEGATPRTPRTDGDPLASASGEKPPARRPE